MQYSLACHVLFLKQNMSFFILSKWLHYFVLIIVKFLKLKSSDLPRLPAPKVRILYKDA